MSSENVIEYRIFHSDAKLLGSIRSHCEDLVNSLGKDYIWQKESFGLSSVEESSGERHKIVQINIVIFSC